jgi:hypothetical protein
LLSKDEGSEFIVSFGHRATKTEEYFLKLASDYNFEGTSIDSHNYGDCSLIEISLMRFKRKVMKQ